MKFPVRLGSVALFILMSSSALYAQPRYESYGEFYDDNGNSVGYFFLNCNGGHGFGGTQTANFVMVYSVECEPQPTFSCDSVGLVSIGDCQGSGWCVSEGYALSFLADTVMDCHGRCFYGEGPNPDPEHPERYCNSCWGGTGSCPQ